MGNDRLEDPKQDGKTCWGHIESRITRRTLELERKSNGKKDAKKWVCYGMVLKGLLTKEQRKLHLP